jgi:hypothetical protein
MRRRITTAARNYQIGGFVTTTRDAWGRLVTNYNDLPILIVDLDNTGTAIIDNVEACTSGTATGTSIYVVSFGPGMLTGLQNGSMDVRDLGELQTSPLYRTRVEWYNGIAIFNGRAATRLWSIADAAVTA